MSRPQDTRRHFLKTAGLTAISVGLAGCQAIEEPQAPQPVSTAVARPNILWLTCEDTGPHLGCYGDPHAITPTLDALAARGIRYTNAFMVAGVCAPSRSSIITGMYPTTLGTHHMRAGGEGSDGSTMPKLPADIRCFSEYLRQAGYYCTNNVKQDYNFVAPKGSWDESSNKAHWRNRPRKDQPFFAVFNNTVTHESSLRASDEQHAKATARLQPQDRQDPAKITPPPWHPDTPVVRKEWAWYYENITAVDYWVADHLRDLDAEGLTEDTIVFFYGDHGPGMPRAKRWVLDSGTHVPLLIRIPVKFRVNLQGIPGTVENELVSSIDLAPTVLNLAQAPVPRHMQGRAFLGPNVPPKRQYVFSCRDRMDERYDIIRSVRDNRFRYVRHYEPYKPYFQNVSYGELDPIMKELRRMHKDGALTGDPAQRMKATKPREELYDLQADPHELNNLANDPQYDDVLQRLRAAHLEWMLSTRDMGLVPEHDLAAAEQQRGSRYEMMLQNNDEYRRRTLFQLAALAGAPDITCVTRFADALADTDPAMRYWGAVGLGNLGEDARPALDFTAAGTEDPSPVVRIAAARALWKLSLTDRALAVLTAELASPNMWARLAAVTVLDEMGEAARPAIPALQTTLADKPGGYVTRILEPLLSRFLDET